MSRAPSAPPPPDASLDDAFTLGDALRAARDRAGGSLAEFAARTRVPIRYLAALEQNDYSVLPNRAFSTGYVRSYAMALGLDEHDAVSRFKQESPDSTVPLQAPSGVAFQDVRRASPYVAGVVAAVLIAVVGWNIVRRVSLIEAPHPSDIAELPKAWAAADDADRTAPLALEAPRAAPADQNLPDPYITKGLETELAMMVRPGADGADASAAPIRRAFNPRGAVYGAPANASNITIQARKPAALVVNVGGNRALFARQLAEGDAWRAPLGVTATINANDPAAFDVYLNGEYAGVLTAEQTPLSQLGARAAAQARASALQTQQIEEARRRAIAEAAADLAARTPPTPAPTVGAPPVPAG